MKHRVCGPIKRLMRCGGAALVTLVTAACAFNIDRVADSHDLQQSVLPGTQFTHLVLQNDVAAERGRLHVYIEGDGIPWHFGRIPSSDPTPKNPVALKLMLQDDAARAYVGRPCHFATAANAGCESSVWTSGRYSREVVDSMAAVIKSLDLSQARREIVIFGYSGGGVLARLLADEVDGVVAIVTIAANLDTNAWTESHGYLPLTRSINPAGVEPLPPNIRHLQLIGDQDKVVVPAITQSYRAAGQDVSIWLFRGFDHRCCWQDEWTSILESIETAIASPGDGFIDDRQF